MELGTSRNAVIGKAHRLKLAQRGVKPGQGRGRRRVSRRQPNASAVIFVAPKAIVVPVPAPEPVPGGVSILDLEHHHCRAVIGTGNDGLARYCGAHKEGRIQARRGGFFDSAYCRAHGETYFQSDAIIR